MPAGYPFFKLYQSDGSTLVYNFDNMLSLDDFQDPFTFAEHISLRGQGSIISEGSDAPWDMNISFMLTGDDYDDLVSQMNSLLTTIAKNTKYVLKVDLTSSTTKIYKVKRLQSFVFPLDNKKKRVNFQTVNAILRVASWA